MNTGAGLPKRIKLEYAGLEFIGYMLNCIEENIIHTNKVDTVNKQS